MEDVETIATPTVTVVTVATANVTTAANAKERADVTSNTAIAAKEDTKRVIVLATARLARMNLAATDAWTTVGETIIAIETETRAKTATVDALEAGLAVAPEATLALTRSTLALTRSIAITVTWTPFLFGRTKFTR